MNCNCECKMLNITAGTDITLAVTLRRDGKLFPVELSDSVKVNMVSQRGVRKSVSCRVGTGKVAVPLLGEDFSVGVYGVEVTGKLNGANWRTFGASVVKYTYETERGAARVIANGDTYDIELEVGPMSDIVPHSLSELDSDPGHRTVTDDEKERWNEGSGKINIVKVDGEPLDIDPTDKSVDIDLSGKQDTISDLDEIRDGAALGATAIQEHQDISGKVDKVDGKGLSTNDYTNEEKQSLNAAIEQAERVNATLDTETNIVTITDSEGVSNSIDLTNKTNVELEGSVITVTNKEGVEKEIDLQDATDERVFINCSTTVEGTSVSGLSINVYYGDILHTTLTTNAQGSARIDIPNGTTYKIVFPRLVGCNPIPDVKHTAVMSQRSVEAVYVEEFIAYEHVKFNVKKADTISDIQPFEGVEVKVEYGEHVEHYVSDAQGMIEFDIPIGTTYVYTVNRPDGYYMYEGRTSFTKTAMSSLYEITIKLVPYDTGIYIITQQGGQYHFDEFQTAVEGGLVQRSDARLIKIATEILCSHDSPFCISIDDITEMELTKGAWANSTSIMLGGTDMFDGYDNTLTILSNAATNNVNARAALLCVQQNVVLDTITLDGFLGSVNQWTLLWGMKDTIDEMILYCRPSATRLLSNITDRKYTSVESSASTVYSFGTSLSNGNKNIASFFGYTIPFYAI